MSADNTRRRGASVEPQLHNIWAALAAGAYGLDQVTPSIMGIYMLGYTDGHANQPEQTALDNAHRDADRYYELWANPGKKLSELRQRRIDQALDAMTGDPGDGDPADVFATILDASQPTGGAA